MNDKEILESLLEITEDKKAGKLFLKQFRSLKPETFAALYISPDVIAQSGEALLYEIKQLFNVHLFPVLFLHKDSISYIKQFYLLGSNRAALQQKIPVTVIRKRQNLKQKIIQAIKNNTIPAVIINPAEGGLFTILRELCLEIETNKLIYLWNHAGIRDKDTDSIIYNIYINKNLDDILENRLKTNDEKDLLTNIKSVFKENSNSAFSVVVTAPVSLLKELFTVKGSGTLIKRGCKITIHNSVESTDMEKLEKMISDSFKKKLKPGFFRKNFDLIILETQYRGCAVLKQTSLGHFLSKYAVDDIARGEGIGGEIWDAMRKNCPVIFWRAKKENSINQWYCENADGIVKTGNWNIYWIGLATEKISEVADFLLRQEEDFE